MGLPVGWIELKGLLQWHDGLVVFVLVDECHAKSGKGSRILGIDLRRFLKRGLRLFRFPASQQDYSLQVKDVRMTGRKFRGFFEIFFRLIEFVLIERLQAFVERFFCFRGEDRASSSSERLSRRITLKDDLLF